MKKYSVKHVVDKLQAQVKECGDIYPLEYALKHGLVPNDPSAVCVELGVASGRTINLIGHYLPLSKVYGFDSFDGLPEDWHDGVTLFKKGAFSTGGSMPNVPCNVTLVKGWFNETLPQFKAILGETPIALLHVDCDLYSSTKCGFDVLKNNIVPGTIIVFDELWNYTGFQEHEIKAFVEFLNETGYDFEGIVCSNKSCAQQIAVRLLSSG